MKDTVISVSRNLLEKCIAFCVYRLPDEDSYHLAIEPGHSPHQNGQTFLISPFAEWSDAKKFTLSVVNDDHLKKDSFREFVDDLPAQPGINVSLPPETTHDEYFDRINIFLQNIKSGNLTKVVLSRTFNVAQPENFDPLFTFENLANSYPKAFIYFFQHRDAGLWMGATPELLLRKRDAELFTIALAGTQARKEKGEYYWRTKEKDEHQILWGHIENVFGKHGYEFVKKDGPKTIESGQVAHLRTDYTYREKKKSDIRELIKDLHPTPAIGGLPVKEALDCIKKNEGYDRKYYCGIIGQTDFSNTADLYVNLRCMQIGKDQIAIFVGGGITAASDPQEEWEETVVKSKTLLDKLKMV